MTTAWWETGQSRWVHTPGGMWDDPPFPVEVWQQGPRQLWCVQSSTFMEGNHTVAKHRVTSYARSEHATSQNKKQHGFSFQWFSMLNFHSCVPSAYVPPITWPWTLEPSVVHDVYYTRACRLHLVHSRICHEMTCPRRLTAKCRKDSLNWRPLKFCAAISEKKKLTLFSGLYGNRNGCGRKRVWPNLRY